MPRVAPVSPRKMLPPPTTIAISTSRSRQAAATSSAIRCTTLASMPKPLVVSAKTSPESFRITRRYRLRAISATPPALASFLADLDSREAPDRRVGAEGLDDLGDRGLGLLHEPLLEEHVVLVEPVQPTLDDLVDRVLRLALVARQLGEHLALLVDGVRRDILTTHEPRRGARD